MAKDMLGTAVRKLVTLPAATLGIVCDLLEKLADQEWVAALKQFLRKENPWVATGLLEDAGTITIPAVPAFDVSARFHEMTEKERKTAEVPIGWMGDDAKRLVKGLIEPEAQDASLTIYRLRKASVDGPIITELRGERDEQAILTTWSQMYEMMKTQGHAADWRPRLQSGWGIGCPNDMVFSMLVK